MKDIFNIFKFDRQKFKLMELEEIFAYGCCIDE